MRIDAHQHYWHYDPVHYPWIEADMTTLRRDALPAEAAALMDAHGIDAAIAVQARCSEDDTAWLLNLARHTDRIAAIVGWVDLTAADASERIADWRAAPELRGLRHIVQDEPEPAAMLADPAFGAGVRAAQDAGLVYELLVRADDLAAAIDFCRRHDRHHLVLDHVGKPAIGDGDWQPWANRLAALAALAHVSCKLSGLATEARADDCGFERIAPYSAHALDCFGPDRLMFGSDWPVCTLANDYATVHAQAQAAADAAGLNAGERLQLFGETATRIYGLSDHHQPI